ncbi:MAG: hypothetical protein BWY54_00747 [Candidatus Dependentiae bacterium ADurb.Bin331]|nr:MAG: hypothetical protein BWY54_00747 [Candidatus Dependentiae bacterium ADurb.Bin331]
MKSKLMTFFLLLNMGMLSAKPCGGQNQLQNSVQHTNNQTNQHVNAAIGALVAASTYPMSYEADFPGANYVPQVSGNHNNVVPTHNHTMQNHMVNVVSNTNQAG